MFFCYPPKNPVKAYNSCLFKQEFTAYMSIKKMEHDSCNWVGKLFTHFEEKQKFQTELFSLIDCYEAAKQGTAADMKTARTNLLDHIYNGAYQLHGLTASTMSLLLRQWYFRLENIGAVELKDMSSDEQSVAHQLNQPL